MDPEQAAFMDIFDAKFRYMENVLGEERGIYANITAKSNSIYNLKLAVKYQDRQAAEKYLAEYINYGGTGRGMVQSIKTMHPSYGLKKGEFDNFYNNFLTAEERQKYDRAVRFYNDVLTKDFTELVGNWLY